MQGLEYESPRRGRSYSVNSGGHIFKLFVFPSSIPLAKTLTALNKIKLLKYVHL
jgi:hypothetical protein